MAFRSISSANGGGSATPTVNVPTGVATDDIVILLVEGDTPAWAFSSGLPAGFTLFTAINLTVVDGGSIGAFWKRATGADTGTYAFASQGAICDWQITAIAFSGRHTTNPPVSTPTTTDSAQATGASITGADVTALSGDDLALLIALDKNLNTPTASLSQPTSYTEQLDAADTNGWNHLAVDTRDNVSSGATGVVTSTLTISGGETTAWASYHVRIPDGGGGGGGGAAASPLQIIRSNIRIGP